MVNYEWQLVASSTKKAKGQAKGQGQGQSNESSKGKGKGKSGNIDKGRAKGGCDGSQPDPDPWILCRNPNCTGWIFCNLLRQGTACQKCKLVFSPPPGATGPPKPPKSPSSQSAWRSARGGGGPKNASGESPTVFDLAEHLSALLAAKDHLPPEHANLLAAAESSLAVAKPPSPKVDLSTAHTAVAAALAVQTSCQDKCSKLQSRVKQHMDLVQKFLGELEDADARLANAQSEYAKAAQQASNIADSCKSGTSLDSPLSQPIDFSICTSLKDLLGVLDSLPADHRKFLATNLEDHPTPMVIDSANTSCTGDLKDEEPSSDAMASNVPIEAHGPLPYIPGLASGSAAPVSSSEVPAPPDAGTPQPFGPSSRSVDAGNSSACGRATRSTPYPNKPLSALSSSDELKEKCKDYAKVVETALKSSSQG